MQLTLSLRIEVKISLIISCYLSEALKCLYDCVVIIESNQVIVPLIQSDSFRSNENNKYQL